MKSLLLKLFVPIGILTSIITMESCGGGKSAEKDQKVTPAINKADMDTTINAGEDFYSFANGGWLKAHPVPSTESSWGSFNELRNNNMATLKKILDDASKNTAAKDGSNEQKLRDFYTSGMDSVAINKLGLSPIEPQIKMIEELKTKEDIIKWVAYTHKNGIGTVFNGYVDQDAKQSDVYAFYLTQGGGNLPDKDYYLKDDEKSVGIRKAYLEYVETMHKSAKMDKTAKEDAKLIMAMETDLAKGSMGRVEMRDPNATYHKMTMAELIKMTPNINWNIYFTELGAKDLKSVIVSQPVFYKKLNDMLASYKMEDWKKYFTWQLVNSAATELSSELEMNHFKFFGTTLSGTKELEPRWKRILKITDGVLGEVLGQEYVKVAFKPEAKEKMVKMVQNLRDAFAERIKALDWMSQPTKDKAIEKLNKITVKIGYPDKWKDYSTLTVKAGDYFGNVARASEFEFKRNLAKLGKPIDRSEWGMTPPTVNAYYNPAMNEIVFPAGILQPPFFRQDGDDAMNYGSIGAVIGHELTHGFDDEGRQFDAEGNLKDWWTKEDADKFNEKVLKLEKQFNEYIPIDSLHINGKLTLGENLADLGGLTISYQAYKKSLAGKEDKVIDGFTGDQRFYLAWSQGWKTNYTPEALRKQVLTNPHSPGKFRVLGPLSNLETFAKAFSLKEGSKMIRTDKVKVW